MSDYKEFEGKTLDIAITNACDFFNTEREKLEIDILEDAKSGIFGFIGARNAKISARKATLPEFSSSSVVKNLKNTPKQEKAEARAESKNEAKAPAQQVKHTPVKSSAPTEQKQNAKHSVNADGKKENEAQTSTSEKVYEKKSITPKHSREHAKNQRIQQEKKAEVKTEPKQPKHTEENAIKRPPLTELDQDQLINVAHDVVKNLLKLIIEDDEITVEVQNERLCISINTENTGLLIGKEGQTLQAIEYLATRIISKEMNTNIRVQVEVGDYRTRQDQRLHEFALSLADKVIASGKSMSTRPLSAYQRRIVHLALQEMPDVQTRSIGEGALKRVVLSKVKQNKKI